MNFDEYDKSDDPHDYKFVRWLTKEKVSSELLVLKVNMRTLSTEMVKGTMSWGFCRFLAHTILQLVVGNLIHLELYL